MQKKDILRKRRHAKIRKKISGTSTRPRLVVVRTLRNVNVQLIDDDAGKTLVSASDIKTVKGTKTERATSVGTEIAKKALEQKIVTCVFDRNGYKYHGRVKAIAEAAREAGLKF
jgi:large subunit ribosomal protein L18